MHVNKKESTRDVSRLGLVVTWRLIRDWSYLLTLRFPWNVTSGYAIRESYTSNPEIDAYAWPPCKFLFLTGGTIFVLGLWDDTEEILGIRTSLSREHLQVTSQGFQLGGRCEFRATLVLLERDHQERPRKIHFSTETITQCSILLIIK